MGIYDSGGEEYQGNVYVNFALKAGFETARCEIAWGSAIVFSPIGSGNTSSKRAGLYRIKMPLGNLVVDQIRAMKVPFDNLPASFRKDKDVYVVRFMTRSTGRQIEIEDHLEGDEVFHEKFGPNNVDAFRGLFFEREEDAERAVKSLRHLATLCGSHRDPF
jgi:hypothetical protein